jgi:negative regulator of flagellin synthesis FlgM
MKIDELSQPTVATYVAKLRSEKHDTQSEAPARQQPAADKVELSSNIPVASAAGDDEDTKANRLEELKHEIANGSYNVPAMAVAEKMMANIVK